MKNFERPRFAIYNQKTEKLINQISLSEILLLLNSLTEGDRKYVYIFSPQLRKWLSWTDLPECQVPFKLERGLKAPNFSLQGLKSSQPHSKPISSATKPLVAEPKPLNSIPIKKMELPPLVSKASPPSALQPGEELTEEIIIDETISHIPSPSPSPHKPAAAKVSPEKLPQSPSESVISAVSSSSSSDELTENIAAKNLDNPFSSLKRSVRREKLVPSPEIILKSPLQPLGPESIVLMPERENLPSRWIKLSGQRIVLEPVHNGKQKSLITKVSFPFLLMDQSFDSDPGSLFAVKVTYMKQVYNLEAYIHPNSSEKNILKITDSLDFKSFKDLFKIIGAA